MDHRKYSLYCFPMRFAIAPGIFERFPDFLVGVLSCHDLQNPASPPEVIAALRETERAVRATFADSEALKQHPAIAAQQELHRAFGSNPNKFPPSSFALAKRVVKGGELPAINTLVDLYNTISLQYLLPVGGEDLAACSGDILLTIAEGGEPFTPLGETENDPPVPNEFVYRDDAGIICRRLNWREGERTCLTEKTRDAVLVIEAIPPATRETLQKALEELREAVMTSAGGTITASVLDRTRSAIML